MISRQVNPSSAWPGLQVPKSAVKIKSQVKYLQQPLLLASEVLLYIFRSEPGHFGGFCLSHNKSYLTLSYGSVVIQWSGLIGSCNFHVPLTPSHAYSSYVFIPLSKNYLDDIHFTAELLTASGLFHGRELTTIKCTLFVQISLNKVSWHFSSLPASFVTSFLPCPLYTRLYIL